MEVIKKDKYTTIWKCGKEKKKPKKDKSFLGVKKEETEENDG